MSSILFTNIGEVLTLKGALDKKARHATEDDLGSVKKAVIAVRDGKVAWIGESKKFTSALRKKFLGAKSIREVDLKGRAVLPGFVECHTHLVFAGSRQDEMDWKIKGLSYQEIAERGGGIRSTVKATRAASAKELFNLSQARVDRFVQQGVTCLEIKSGYGLDLKSELKILEVARGLRGPQIVTTFLGPHAVPAEFQTAAEYLEFVQHNILPQVVKKKLAERVDIFIEKGFFSNEQARQWFMAARESGLQIVAHTDQLTAGGGSQLAIEHQAISVDHAIHLSKAEIKQLAASKTTAVLLPASDFYLGVNYPQARALIDQGACVALATDYNPGTSPTQDLSLVGVLSRLQMRMTLAEVLVAYTLGAATALGRSAVSGHLNPGAYADLAVLDGSWRDLFYNVGYHPVNSVWRAGRPLGFS